MEKLDKLRVAIVGAGYVAGYHITALKRLPYVEIVGICDLDSAAATAMAAKFGIAMSAQRLAELAQYSPNVVYVLTPPASHCAITLEALDMGCHVFVEKPMADSVAECDLMTARAKERGRIISVNHSDRFDPVVLQALDAVRTGRAGDPMFVDILRSSEYPPYGGGPLPAVIRQGSYPFRDLGVHGLYTLEAFLGPVKSVNVSFRGTGRDPNLRFDEWHATAECERGTGRLLLSWNVRPMENRLIVHATKSVIEADRFLQIVREMRVLPGPKFIGIVLGAFLNGLKDVFRIPWNVVRFATGSLQPSPGIQASAAEFARALHEGLEPPVGTEEARRSVVLMESVCNQADAERAAELAARKALLPPVDALVTGANGFLGTRVVRALREKGVSVRVLVRRPVPAYAADPGIQIVTGDLGDPDIVSHAVSGASVVYHVGAAMKGGPKDFEAGTVWGTRNVVEACLRHGTSRVVYVSSMSVFDHAGRDTRGTMTEASTLEPQPQLRGAYTQTKLTAEHIVRAAITEKGLPAVIIRPGQIFGPGVERVTPNGVVALAGRWLAIGSASQTLPLVYVDDVVDALQIAAENPAAVGKTFNVVDTTIVTQGDYLARAQTKLGDELRVKRVSKGVFMSLAFAVEMLGKSMKRDMPLTRYRVRSLRPLANFDVQQARDVMRWQPKIGTTRGLELTFGPKR